MTRTRAEGRLARAAWGVLAGNVAVILWGAYVRATGSGAGCGGHWPTCHGEVLPRDPSTATLIELSHRATSGLAFGAVLLLGACVLFFTPKRHPARRPAVLAMILMLGEVLIGALIVVLGHVALDPSLLHGFFTELHAGNTFLLLAALTLTARHLGPPRAAAVSASASEVPYRGEPVGGDRSTPPLRAALTPPLVQAYVALALTVLSGAIAALGDTLFPARSLREGFEADLSAGAHLFLHVRTFHPVFATVATLLIASACAVLRSRRGVSGATRRAAAWAFGLTAAQVAVGLVNLWLLVPIGTQMLHLACADALFIALVVMTSLAYGDARREDTRALTLPPEALTTA